jgi:hypothetical protein
MYSPFPRQAVIAKDMSVVESARFMTVAGSDLGIKVGMDVAQNSVRPVKFATK